MVLEMVTTFGTGGRSRFFSCSSVTDARRRHVSNCLTIRRFSGVVTATRIFHCLAVRRFLVHFSATAGKFRRFLHSETAT
jgi:hypothetical protein